MRASAANASAAIAADASTAPAPATEATAFESLRGYSMSSESILTAGACICPGMYTAYALHILLSSILVIYQSTHAEFVECSMSCLSHPLSTA